MEQESNWHKNHKEKRLFGRYITLEKVTPLLEEITAFFQVNVAGYSVQNRPIHTIKIGRGTTKILMWSQMHGNESTTTKAVFDFIKSIQDRTLENWTPNFFDEFTFCIIPILNPDGACLYTRNNANDVDLNRDAQEQTQPESVVLKTVFEEFSPDYCFNLHGQRTIYGFEKTGMPSVLSFLAPSADKGRSVTLSRKRSMSIITSIYNNLQVYLPGQIGRYDDGFNINCVGDTFQSLGVPTVLFEAGHTPNDYQREKTREYIFLALISALKGISSKKSYDVKEYENIPEHQKCFCDVLITNTPEGQLAIQYKEVLHNNSIQFVPQIADKDLTNSKFGHRLIDAQGGKIDIIYKKDQGQNIDIADIFIDNELTITL